MQLGVNDICRSQTQRVYLQKSRLKVNVHNLSNIFFFVKLIMNSSFLFFFMYFLLFHEIIIFFLYGILSNEL